MNFEINSANPAVRAIIEGTAPRPARMAAARGILPLAQNDLLEILVALSRSEDAELAETARVALGSQDREQIGHALQAVDIAPQVLGYFAQTEELPKEFYETIITHTRTPETAIAAFARKTKFGELLEILALNQQLLIQTPAIIEAIIGNPFRTAEAERRARETKHEFFEKERGAQQVADELRAQGKEAAAEFVEKIEDSEIDFDDAMFLAEHIESLDSEVDDSWLALGYLEEIYEESEEQRQMLIDKIIGEMSAENEAVSGDRISMISRIMKFGIKDRVKLAMKGDREARNILIRDSNRIVAQAVIQNPRITDQEVEKISSMRTAPEEVLRQIANNRQWARSYSITHNLARNPRMPVGNVMGILTRLQTKDLESMMKNRNVSDAVRKQAMRILSGRKGR